ncbi:MAG: hypothetical protein ACQEXJ_10495 [Myxococcota bacterium]
MILRRALAPTLTAALLLVACGGDDGGSSEPDAGPQVTEHPDCEDFEYTGTYLLPGPCEEGFDADLAAKTRDYERLWHAFNAAATGVNTDVSIDVDHAGDRALVEQWVQEEDGWDFDAWAGKSAVHDVITRHHKVAGLYGGVGIAADAFRYGVLRDQGYPAEEVERARQLLLTGIEGLFRAMAVTGEPGMIARGYTRSDLPGGSHIETTPLADEDGTPLPQPKNNGEWREDRSGEYPDYIWEDSISRDQMLGWVTAAGAIREVIRDDPAFDQALEDRLQEEAKLAGRELMKVRPNGYDLEIWDPDGRRTQHGCVHEEAVDCSGYIEGMNNGFHAVMALGFVATWAWVSGDPELESYLYDELLGDRALDEIARDHMIVYQGKGSNYSNYNMAFGSLWLAQRYIQDADALEALREALVTGLYAIPNQVDQPEILKRPYYDFIYAAGVAGHDPSGPLRGEPDDDAMARGLETMHEYPNPPYWDEEVLNCPEAQCTCEEPDAGVDECVGLDGETVIDVLGCVGRKCDLIADQPTPMRIRPPSNYHWRSNPFEFNGGADGTRLMPAVDFRIAYWKARWVKRSR